MAVCAAILTVPAYFPNDAGIPVAFLAVTSIAVIGLYIAYAIPIYLRWKVGDAFRPGGWTLGRKYRWMSIVAVVEIVITSVVALFPTSSGGAPWYDGFDWKYVNYTVLVVPGALILLWIYWHLSVKKWFTGPKTTVDEPVLPS